MEEIKCLVWDLDDTVWEGTLAEGTAGSLRPNVLQAIKTLDARGILNSVASRNNEPDAMEHLKKLGIAQYFVAPQINWGAKSASIGNIISALNLSSSNFGFIDDRAFEREEAASVYPDLRLYDADMAGKLTELPEFNPRFVTDDSINRRQYYQAGEARTAAEKAYSGPNMEFLKSLQMVFSLNPAKTDDLKRAYELTVRTHQLNTTGLTYDYDELALLQKSSEHLLLMADLKDRFGPYGKIGLALVEKGEEAWNIKLLLMSCRVAGRGVGTIMLHRIMEAAFAHDLKVRADFRANGRNDMMLATYRFAGFRTVSEDNGTIVLEAKPHAVPLVPDYVRFIGGIEQIRK